MAYPVNRPSDEMTVNGYLADISTSSSAYVVAPVRGWIREFNTVIDGAISAGDATVTLKTADGTTITSVLVEQSGSAAGDVDTSGELVKVGTTNYVNEGDALEVHTNGGSTDTAVCRFGVVIRKN